MNSPVFTSLVPVVLFIAIAMDEANIRDLQWSSGGLVLGQKLGQAELARADVIIRPKVLDLGSVDFSQRAGCGHR